MILDQGLLSKHNKICRYEKAEISDTDRSHIRRWNELLI